MVRLQSIKRILEDLQKQIRSLRAASNEELRRTNNNTNLSASNNDSDDDDLEAATQLGEKKILYTYVSCHCQTYQNFQQPPLKPVHKY